MSMQCGVGEGIHNDWVLSRGWKQPMLPTSTLPGQYAES